LGIIFSGGVISRWKLAEQAISQGIDWIMAKMQGGTSKTSFSTNATVEK
jgi:hypothetical protein